MRIEAIAVAVLIGTVAGAAAGPSQTVSGRVELPTFGSPAIPRLVYAAAGVNGAAGYVFEVAAAGRPFTLGTVEAPTGLEDFDIAFYSSLEDTQPIAAFDDAGAESGVVPAGAAWAVVTMSTGVGGSFSYVAS